MSHGAVIIASSKSLFVILLLAHVLKDSTFINYRAECINDDALANILYRHYKFHKRINEAIQFNGSDLVNDINSRNIKILGKGGLCNINYHFAYNRCGIFIVESRFLTAGTCTPKMFYLNRLE